MVVSFPALRARFRRQIRGCLLWIAICTAVFYLDSSNRNFDDFLFCLFLAIPAGVTLHFVLSLLGFAMLPQRN